MIRLAMVLVAAAVLLAVAWVVATAVSRAARLRLKRPPRGSRAPGGYEWERRRDQLYRRMKSVPGPEEHRDEILEFVESRRGVEAYLEPRTVIHPLSVVLVAEDGEWVRHQLKDDAFIRELARARKLAIHDAAKVGYPERMRRYRRGLGPETPGPSAEE
ncbi:MAG: hypothetical protein ACRDHO_09280 [Actinomycetota bacterium]